MLPDWGGEHQVHDGGLFISRYRHQPNPRVPALLPVPVAGDEVAPVPSEPVRPPALDDRRERPRERPEGDFIPSRRYCDHPLPARVKIAMPEESRGASPERNRVRLWQALQVPQPTEGFKGFRIFDGPAAERVRAEWSCCCLRSAEPSTRDRGAAGSGPENNLAVAGAREEPFGSPPIPDPDFAGGLAGKHRVGPPVPDRQGARVHAFTLCVNKCVAGGIENRIIGSQRRVIDLAKLFRFAALKPPGPQTTTRPLVGLYVGFPERCQETAFPDLPVPTPAKFDLANQSSVWHRPDSRSAYSFVAGDKEAVAAPATLDRAAGGYGMPPENDRIPPVFVEHEHILAGNW